MYSSDLLSDNLLTYMVWIHLAIVAVPMIIFTMKLEWDEVKDHRRTEAAQKRPLRPQPVTFQPTRV